MRQRDSQKSKLYKAENGSGIGEERLETIQEIERYVRKLLASKRFLKRYPFMRQANIRISDGRGCRIARGGYGGLTLPRWARSKRVILHELAHCVHRRGHGRNEAGHGWRYASIFLTMVRIFLGKADHDTLKASFKANRVKFREPRVGRAPSPQAIEALRRYRANKLEAAKPQVEVAYNAPNI